MSVRRVAAVLGLVFALALAVVVAKRMSAEAMAVVVGVVCGVAASIPTSLLLLLVLGRRDRHRIDEAQWQVRHADYPPVVVIQGGEAQGLARGQQFGYWPSLANDAGFQREFHEVGGGDYWPGERY